MNDYDFSALNDKEFENLTLDLISKERNKRFERFKAGRDKGVDGRYYRDDNKEEIIQCKHYLKTGYSGLISSLKKKNTSGMNEYDKVKILKPKRYIFITSLSLSRQNKQALKDFFTPFIIKDSDIYGQEDLNDILKDNSDVEERYYKLWISSTTVLKRIFNNAIKGRSEYLIDEIKNKIKYYVVTDNHKKAIEVLEKTHTIIIAGEPGIGKTTLAEQVCLFYSEKGYELCVMSNSINEAEDIYNRESKQVFYFDDFLGSNYLQALENHQDTAIVRFINRVKKDKNKRFILTSRTNIINQGVSLSDKFKVDKLERNEFILTVSSLSKLNKAWILYNHIYHSVLPESLIDEIYKDKRYKKIINHSNFNPRLIEFITDYDRLIDNSKEYWNYIEDTLNNPSEIWANTFDKQSDDFIRNIVLLTVFNGNKIEEYDLRNSYNRLYVLMSLSNSQHNKDFESVIPDVIKYFLNRTVDRYQHTVEFTLFNPSIADFIFNRYKNDKDRISKIFLSLKTMESLKQLQSIDNIDSSLLQNIVLKLYEDINLETMKTKDNLDYIIKVIYLTNITLKDIEFDKNKTLEFYKKILSHFREFSLIEEFSIVLELLIISDEINIGKFDFILNMIHILGKGYYDVDKLNSVIAVINELKINDDEIISNLNQYINDNIASEFDGMISDIGFDDVAYEHNDDGYAFARESDIENFIDIYFEVIISSINDFNGIYIDDSIKNDIDIIEISQNLGIKYMDNWGSHDNYYTNTNINTLDSIDDVFER